MTEPSDEASPETPQAPQVRDEVDDVGFREVYDRYVGLLGRNNGPLFYLWFIVAGINLLALLASFYVRSALEGGWVAFGLSGLFGGLSTVAVYATTPAIYAADARGGDLSLNEAIDVSIQHIFRVFVVATAVHASVWIGSACLLIPGLVLAFLLYPAPFLAATQGLWLDEAVTIGVRWARTYFTIGLLSLALFLGVAVVLGTPMYLGYMTLDFHSEGGAASIFVPGSMFTSVLLWGISSVVGYFVWLWGGAVLSSIASREGVAVPGR